MQILCIDDDADIVQAAGLIARRKGMQLTGAENPQVAWSLLAEQRFDLILLDLNFARGNTSGEEGFRMLTDLTAADPHAVVIVITGHSGINIAVEAMRAGASDFVIKPWSNDTLASKLERAATLARARYRSSFSPEEAATPLLLGEDSAIKRIRTLITRIAPTAAPVLITGPAGAGKSLTAQLVHRRSALNENPLIRLPAHADLDEASISSALEQARGGTVLLDNVVELPRALHPWLAARLEGMRIIATARGERGMVRAALDADLLYRLNTIEIEVPSLKERCADKALLARHFVERFSRRHGVPVRTLSDEALGAILADDWPDEVRGLQQAIERAVLLAGGEEIVVADLGIDSSHAPDAPLRAGAADLNLDRTERRLIEAALDRHRFNISRAAEELGLTRAALYRRMAKHGL
ncbi:sigma-54 dependent transcriptional regulator [Stakelama sediminis]|uniref:DNA-binding NtrC family response regulator n=1 Tax=Stakelama sediminis TaxID=463200 RepID=A0A840YZL0_9SPHN|nr:DNA-binding NtrC family response regulator [Stakelama sediminis]